MFTLQMFSGQITELIKDGKIQGFQVKGDSSGNCALQMQNFDEALCCQLMHIASDSLEIAKSSLKLLDLARFS